MIVRRAREEDAAYIAELEKEIFSDAWSEEGILESMTKGNAWIYVAYSEENSRLLAYVIFYPVLDEGEIARIACAEKARRQGVSSRILQVLEKESAEKGIWLWHLDVRESNEGARAFYIRHGFVQDGIRKAYYDHPREDAVLMTCKLETLSAVHGKNQQI